MSWSRDCHVRNTLGISSNLNSQRGGSGTSPAEFFEKLRVGFDFSDSRKKT